MLLVKIMLCSKLRCQKYSRLKDISYEIHFSSTPEWTSAWVERSESGAVDRSVESGSVDPVQAVQAALNPTPNTNNPKSETLSTKT